MGFNPKDLSESIRAPDRVISDQYRAHTIVTLDGRIHTGQIVTETDTALTVLIDPEDASKVVEVSKEDVEALQPSPVSIMPQDLLDPLNRDEVLDLLAYLLSRGNPEDPMFRP